ncbi:MAG: hypothetical protein KJ558_04595 [Gammaproteobacteria bacterium]|nr:hypothetical protein [Gammaproteobacteria bacterium]MBU1654099.1 hypothetical protein [Gammaproteobacteria bacterium]MBU1961684.1 hypothetical protein [Gammaproteobacteria bacterium]
MCELDKIRRFYVNREDKKLLALTEELWQNKRPYGLSAENGEICRYAMLAAFRQAKEIASDKNNYYARGLTWKSRARVMFSASASFTGEAMMLIPDAYAVAFEFKRFDLAREILHEMPRLIELDNRNAADQIPSKAMVERCYPEKVGYFYFREEQYSDGKAYYQKALDATNNDPRGRLKVQLGLANCNFGVSGNRGSSALIKEMQRIHREAEAAYFQDVVYVAEVNNKILASNSEINPQNLKFVEI